MPPVVNRRLCGSLREEELFKSGLSGSSPLATVPKGYSAAPVCLPGCREAGKAIGTHSGLSITIGWRVPNFRWELPRTAADKAQISSIIQIFRSCLQAFIKCSICMSSLRLLRGLLLMSVSI